MSVVPYTQDAYTWELLKMNLRPAWATQWNSVSKYIDKSLFKKKNGKLSWCSKWVWKSLFCCCRVMCAVHIWLDAVGLVFFFLLNLSYILNSVDCLSFQFSFLLHLFWGTVVRYANVWGSWCLHSLFGDKLAYFILVNILVNIWDSVCRRLNSEGTVLGGSFFPHHAGFTALWK